MRALQGEGRPSLAAIEDGAGFTALDVEELRSVGGGMMLMAAVLATPWGLLAVVGVGAAVGIGVYLWNRSG